MSIIKIRNIFIAVSILVIFSSVIQASEINTTAVNQALKRMLNSQGKFTKLEFATGNNQTDAASGSGGSTWSDITGTPTGNSFVSTTPAANKIPYSTTGDLNNWMTLFTRNGTVISPGTITDAISIGTTTQQNNANFTFYGSGSSPITIICNRNAEGNTNTTALMTGTSTPTPNEVLASNSNGAAFSAYLAFDSVLDGNNRWTAATEVAWLRYDYGTGNAYAIRQYNIAVWESTYAPKNWSFEVSNDASSWIVVDNQVNQTGWTQNIYRNYTVGTNTTAYRYYRINITAAQGAGYLDIVEMQLLGIRPDTQVLHITGSGTVLIGTTTSYGTTTAYPFQVAQGRGKFLADGYNSYCYSAIKSVVSEGEEVQDESYAWLKKAVIKKHHPKLRSIDETIAENSAKAEFIQHDYSAWQEAFVGSYTTLINGSATVNYIKMYSDYLDLKEIEWASDLNRNQLIENKRIELESDMTKTNISLVTDDPNTPKIVIEEGNTLSLNNCIGILWGACQAQAKEIESLKTIIGSLTTK